MFAENPCRLSVFGKHILISRSDQILRGCKQSIFCPTSSIDPNQHFLLTTLSQRDVLSIHGGKRDSLWSYKNNSFLTGWEDFVILCDGFCESEVETVVWPESLDLAFGGRKAVVREDLVACLARVKCDFVCLSNWGKGRNFVDIDCDGKKAKVGELLG